MSYYTKHIFVCTNQKTPGKTCCANTGGEPFFEYLKEQLSARGLYGPHKTRVSKSGCLGRCALGPCMVIYPEGVRYTYETPADLDEIIDQHLVSGQHVTRLLINSE